MAASMKCSSRPSPPRETARIRLEGPGPAAGARSGRPSLSVIVEWENARLAEARRPLLMLEALARQLEEDAAGGARAPPGGGPFPPNPPARARPGSRATPAP